MSKFRFLVVFWAGVYSASAAEFFPLQAGNTWTYQSTSTRESFTVEVGNPTVLNGFVYFPLRGYTPHQILVRLNEQRDLVQVNEATFQEQALTLFTPVANAWWEAPSRLCGEEGQTLAARGAHDGPAGPFQNVLDIRYRVLLCADAGTLSEQFAENIGMVRRVTSTFIGPRQFDLTYARVGNSEIDSQPKAAFSVSVQADPKAPNLVATLRLFTKPSTASVKLQFPTAQEFEAVLRDESGKEVWKWSDGRAFAQALHEIVIPSGWSQSVPIPRPVRPASTQAAPYTLQAWLTTSGPDMYFASTVPVIIAPDTQAGAAGRHR